MGAKAFAQYLASDRPAARAVLYIAGTTAPLGATLRLQASQHVALLGVPLWG